MAPDPSVRLSRRRSTIASSRSRPIIVFIPPWTPISMSVPRLSPASEAAHEIADRDRRRSPRRRHLHPALALAVGGVHALLESERVEVELERPVLVADGDDHRPHLGDVGTGLGLAHFHPPVGGFAN